MVARIHINHQQQKSIPESTQSAAQSIRNSYLSNNYVDEITTCGTSVN